MGQYHGFSFEGGELLSQIGAWWFVSYKYYLEIDQTHTKWNFGVDEKDKKSIKIRRAKYKKSYQYHKLWLEEILKMQRLDKPKNSANLSPEAIKTMAQKLLQQINKVQL